MAEPTHWLDDVADEVANSMDAEAEWYAEAIRGGARSPFAAPISEKQKLDQYTRVMFRQKPDGTIDWDAPNEDGRAKLMSSAGPKGYAEVATAVLRTRPKTGVIPLDQLIAPPPSALPPLEQPLAYGGPTPLGMPPGVPPDPLLQPPAPPPAMPPAGLPPGLMG